ncbi:MAG: hypothetical protein Q8Q88_19540 [Phenylobacterium sp.]|uniref:hypothetical protein n=1 Tax=Phenylobacterium sp. TaxID=1871053 RepID=UPI002733A3B6|nr:hypothetical protein [Phenylobacterium sp.]MDP3749235.1 hypothetical protein [Phenylobacterium sp.]
MAAPATNDDIYRVLSTALDTAFYRGAYEDLRGAPIDPVTHYAQTGWREGRDPAAWFSTSHYLSVHEDVAQSGVNPFYHYLTSGLGEGRDIVRSASADRYLFDVRTRSTAWAFETGAPPGATVTQAAPGDVVAPITASERALIAANFDVAFYLGANADVAASGQNPLEHFLATGWRERRDPTSSFSFNDYMELNPDVAGSRMNPYVHYLVAGRAEGRAAKHGLGFRYDVIAKLRSMEDRLLDAKRFASAVRADRPAALARALSTSRSGLRDLHLTFSHDNYATNVGGLQFCLQREGERIAALGRDHLHVFPSVPWPTVREQSPPTLGVLWNGELVGHFPPAAVSASLRAALSDVLPGERSFAIHNLLGHAAQDVLDIVGATGLSRGFFWIHDFASLCDGFHLMRNDVADCGAPPPESNACSICVYGPLRRRQIEVHERLFDALSLTAVAPSQAALDTWRAGWSFPTEAQLVLPHARLVERAAPKATTGDGPLRVAYLGIPTPYKGWPIFRDLALRFASDKRYVFVHLAKDTVGGLPIEHHPVSVTAEHPYAMRDAIETLEIDAAMVWSLCRETFSFTAYEAVAAGAAVLTNPDSGNVALFVGAGGRGLVVPNETVLTNMFETGAICELARTQRRPALYDLALSGLTVDLLTEPLR